MPLLVFGIFLLPNFFSHGIFMDGNIYASLSRNLAEGLGSFWDPMLTQTFRAEFHDHPPLAFGLQSIFFWVLGDHFWVERLYSLFALAGHLWVIRAFWKDIFPGRKSSLWLVFLFYALVPTITWSFTNNMLENTMALFSALAVLILFKTRKKFNVLATILAAFFVVCAFYTKGPVSMFPLAVPFFLWLCFREIAFFKMALQTTLFIVFSLGIFAVFYYGSDQAAESWNIYFNKQVVGTITAENPSYGVRRTFILERLLLELIIPLIIALCYVVYAKMKKQKRNKKTSTVWFFVLVGLSAILPIMVSPKQWGFYTVPSILYFVIALGIIVLELKDKGRPILPFKYFKTIRISSLIAFFGVLIFSILNFGNLSRDKGKLGGIMEICEMLPEESVLSADPRFSKDWNLITYFVRYNHIALDFKDLDREYFLGTSETKLDTDYEVVYKKQGEQLLLFRKK